MKLVESVKEFDGWLKRYEHDSECNHCKMTFSIYLPPQAEHEKLPVLYWLSGLTCTDDNVRTKAGAQRYAAEHAVILVMPDTSPRGLDVPDIEDRYDLGKGAGFYVNATQAPWAKHYHMYDYVVKELPGLLEMHFPIQANNKSIFGHSMGGHGALVCALKNPGMYQSVSAFAPICHPINSPWGKNCFSHYLGDNLSQWKPYDAVELIRQGADILPIKISQGSEDEFLAEYLDPESLLKICDEKRYPINYQFHQGYDHSYHFISTFMGEHIAWHAQYLAT